MAAEPQWKCKTELESRRPVFAAALVIVAGQAWSSCSLWRCLRSQGEGPEL